MNKPDNNKTDLHAVGKSRCGSVLKWALRVPLYFLLGIVLLMGTGVLLLQTGLVRDRLRVFLIETANKQLNATVGIERIQGNFLSDISLEGISVTTPDDQPVLFIEKVSVQYLLPMVLAKVIHVNRVRIKGLRLNMVKSPDGRWDFSTLLKPSDKTEKSSHAPFPFLVAIKRFEIADALLALKVSDREATTIRSLQIDRFAARFEYGDTLQLSILESSLTVNTPEAIPIEMTGKALFDPETTGIKMDHLVIQSGPSTINVDGDCRFQGKTPVVDCRIGLDGVDLEDIGRRLLISGMPEGKISGDISVSGATAALRYQISLRRDGAALDIKGTAGFDDPGFRAELSGGIRALDLSKWRAPYTRPLSGVVDADVTLTVTGIQKPKTMDAGASIAIRGVSAADIPLDVIRLSADWSHRKVTIDSFEIVSGRDWLALSGTIEPFNHGSGLNLTMHLERPEMLLDRLSKHLPQIPDTLALKGQTDVSVAVSGWLDNPKARFSINTRNVTGDRMRMDSCDLTGEFQGLPTADGSRAEMKLTATGVRMDRIEAEVLSLNGTLRGPFSRYNGHAELNVRKLLFQDNLISGLDLTADVTPDEAFVSISADHENGSKLEMNVGAAPWAVPEKVVTIENLLLSIRSPWPVSTLKNAGPIRFSTAEDGITVSSCHLEMNDTKFSVEGNLSASESQDVNLQIDQLQIHDIPGRWNDKARLSGSISGEATLRGTLARPVISSRLVVKDLMGYGISQATGMEATAEYAGETATFQATLLKQNTPILSAAGNVPVRFSLAPFSASDGSGNMEAIVETRNLRFSELPIPQLKGVVWDAVADMDLSLSGTVLEPDMSGTIVVRDGHLTLTRNKLTYEQVSGKLLLSNNRVMVEELVIAGDREGRLSASGMIVIGDKEHFSTDLTVNGNNFYIPFQKAVTARVSPRLHLTGGLNNPSLTGEVTITESKINIDRLAEQRYSDIQVVEAPPAGGDEPVIVASDTRSPDYLSPLTADILVRVPKNAWLKGQDVNAEIAGEILVKKKAGGAFRLSGTLHTLRGDYYFMRKNFRLTKGEVEFPGLKEINPNLNIEARTRIKSTDIIVTLHGPADELAIDLSSDPAMEESDIISYLVFGRASDSLGGNQAFNVEKAALGYTGGLLAGELRNLLGDVFFIDSFAIDSGSSENGFGSVTLGKYITPEIFLSHRQGLSENDASYEEITYELTPQLKLETQIGRDNTSSGDLTWEFDF